MNRFCTNCGEELKPGERFCNNCGTPVQEELPEDYTILMPTEDPTPFPAVEAEAEPADYTMPIPAEDPTPFPAVDASDAEAEPTDHTMPIPTEDPTPAPSAYPTPAPSEYTIPEPSAETIAEPSASVTTESKRIIPDGNAGKLTRKGIAIIVVVCLLAAAIGGVLFWRNAQRRNYLQAVATGLGALEAGDYSLAEESYLQAIAMNGDWTEAREGLAFTYGVRGNFDDAKEQYRQLYEKTGDKKYEEAEKEAEEEKLPSDESLNPTKDIKIKDGHLIYEPVASEDVPDPEALVEFLNYFLEYGMGPDMGYMDWEESGLEYDSAHAEDYPIPYYLMGNSISVNYDRYPVEMPERTFSDVETDPRGWSISSGLYGYFKGSDAGIRWIAMNIFHMPEEALDEWLAYGEEEGWYYQEDGYWYTEVGGRGGLMMETRIRDVRTCLGKYYVHFDIVDYWDHNPVADWYAVMGYEEIDGQNYWTMYENHADAPYGFYDSADGEELTELAEELFTELNGWELIYTSGAGAWGAGLEVMEDGRFTFTYHDADMGDTGDGYPGGKLYRSSGSGTFSNVRQVGDYEYTMTVTSIQYDHEDGEYIENDALNIWTNDVIFQEGDEIQVFLPGADPDDLPQERLEAFAPMMGYDPEEDEDLYGPVVYDTRTDSFFFVNHYEF